MIERRAVKTLEAQVARKIAAGEVIDRPNAIIRELMDNAVDSGADKIDVEIYDGGIEKIRVIANGCGLTKEDLFNCARPHATSKITTEQDLLKLTSLGFRGEALASMAAVSHLEIISGGWKMNASVTEDHEITQTALTGGTIVQTSRLFEDFPARRIFLKRPGSEGILCKNTFVEKVLPRPDIEFTFSVDGENKMVLPKGQTLTERFVQSMEIFESKDLFYEFEKEASDKKWSYKLIIGEPSVNRSSRKNIYVYINGRRIQEYSLIQAIEYGCQGYFPNGTHPVACIFIQIDPAEVDFNIHPAKKEVKIKDISSIHHGISSGVKDFLKKYTVEKIVKNEIDSNDNINKNYSMAQLALEEFDEVSEAEKVEADNQITQEKIYGNTSNVESEVNTAKQYSNPVQNLYSPGKTYSANHTTNLRSIFFSNSNKTNSNFENINSSDNNKSFDIKSFKPNYIENKKQKYDFRFLGTTLGTFIVIEKNETLYFIDQHAAHERIIFNKIMKDSSEKQKLLVPYTIQTTSAADDNFLKEMQQSLDEAGFESKDCGDGKWEFYSVPARWKGNERDLEKDLLDKRTNPKDIIYSIAASNACRQAVMDGTVLDDDAAQNLAKAALELEDPHCPHGRPVYTTITRKQLFELVRRT